MWMKILVTGGAGFIGQNVVRELLAQNHEVRVLDSLREDVHEGKSVVFDKEVEFLHQDLREVTKTLNALENVDAVIHLAGKVGLGVDIHDIIDYTSSNDLATAILLDAMAQKDIGKITLASSMVVYGEGYEKCPQHGKVIPSIRSLEDLQNKIFEPSCPQCQSQLSPLSSFEDDPLNPHNVYASTKLAQENLCSSWVRLTGGQAAAMRYHNVYGTSMPKDTPYSGVCAIFISSLKNGTSPQTFEDGKQRRDFINVKDVAKATIAATLKDQDGFRAYNTGSGTVRTIGDMANALSDAFNGPRPVITNKFRLGDVRHITADSTRLKNELGFAPSTSFEEGMKELVEEAS